MESTLVTFSNELAGAVHQLEAHVVSIRARRHYPSSGIRWSPEVIVTADHTIQREEDITITLPDQTTLGATLAGRDPGTDLAVLKVPPGSSVERLRPAGSVQTGELALIVGRSPDSGVNASLGIVSAVSGAWRTWRGGQLDGYIRLDAKLFPQSSGGAVVNARGELIGIATSALSRIAGLAIPASTVAGVVEKILQRGFVPRAYFGVGVQPIPFPDDLRKRLALANRSGLIVLTVESGGPADQAGILIGDILTGVGSATMENVDDLQRYSDSAAIGTAVNVSYVRGGALRQASLTVGERPRKQD